MGFLVGIPTRILNFTDGGCDTEVLAEVEAEDHIPHVVYYEDGGSSPWLCRAQVSFNFEGAKYKKKLSTQCDAKLEAKLWRKPGVMAVCFTRSPATSKCYLSDSGDVTFLSRRSKEKFKMVSIVCGAALGVSLLVWAVILLSLSQRCRQCMCCLPIWTKKSTAALQNLGDQRRTIQPTSESGALKPPAAAGQAD